MPSHPINQEMRTNMRKLMVDVFSLNELKALCFELGVEYEELSASEDTRTAKTIALIAYLDHCRRLPQLLTTRQEKRPSVFADS